MKYLPFLMAGAIIGTLTLIFAIAFATMKNKKEAIGFDRHMKDGEIIRRMLKYMKPYTFNFIIVIFIMLLSISYDIISPLMIMDIEEMIKEDSFAFQSMTPLFIRVGIYAGILIVSLIGTYFQAIILQTTGTKMLSDMREDVFVHIESLSHNQLHHQPVGKLVTRVANDTNAIAMMFTSVLVNLVKTGAVHRVKLFFEGFLKATLADDRVHGIILGLVIFPILGIHGTHVA
jgi:ATP-binding cassette subfamily B protein